MLENWPDSRGPTSSHAELEPDLTLISAPGLCLPSGRLRMLLVSKRLEYVYVKRL